MTINAVPSIVFAAAVPVPLAALVIAKAIYGALLAVIVTPPALCDGVASYQPN